MTVILGNVSIKCETLSNASFLLNENDYSLIVKRTEKNLKPLIPYQIISIAIT